MCHFISWKQGVGVYFLTDADVFSPHGRERLRLCRDNDYLGHGAISAFYGNIVSGLQNKESQDIWEKDIFPHEIARHLESPQTALSTWGEMLRKSLQSSGAAHILLNAPAGWAEAFFDVCRDKLIGEDVAVVALFSRGITSAQRDWLVTRAAGEVGGVCALLRHSQLLRGVLSKAQQMRLFNTALRLAPRSDMILFAAAKFFTPLQRDKLIDVAAKTPETAAEVFSRFQGIRKARRDKLVKKLSRRSELALQVLGRAKHLDHEQRDKLVKIVARSTGRASKALNDSKRYTKTQKDTLIAAVVKNPDAAADALFTRGLTRTQRDKLVAAVVRSPRAAAGVLSDRVRLAKNQRNKLIVAVAQKPNLAVDTLLDLEPRGYQRSKLVAGITKNPTCAGVALRRCGIFTKTQRNKLIAAVARQYSAVQATLPWLGLSKGERRKLARVRRNNKV